MRNKGIWSAVLAIGLWWGLSFRSTPPIQIAVAPSPTQTLVSFIDREALKKALGGDFVLMGRLMADWDIEAQLQEKARLPQDRFLRAQLLSRTLKKGATEAKFLPQSYASAAILLALADPEQLVALPKGMRGQVQLFPEEVTRRIPEDVDRFSLEKLSLIKPHAAFVSGHYSHPATIEALRCQGIPLVVLKSLHNLEAIQEAIREIGEHAGRALEAELLNAFIEAAFLAIDNQRGSVRKSLYVNDYSQLVTPSAQTFTHEQLQWLGLDRQGGMLIDQERLIALNPERLIVSTSHPEQFHYHGAEVTFLDDEVQQSASQYAVLAYYDLVQAVCCE